MAQEQKMFAESLATPTTTFQKLLIGSNIIKGPDLNNRIADKIHIKGLRIEYHFELFMTGAVSAWPLFRAQYLTIGVARDLKRQGSLESRFYLGSNDIPVSHASILAQDKAITRKNLKDMIILSEKTIRADPAGTNAGAYKPFKQGAYYVPVNMEIKYDKNTDVVPYAATDLSKEIYVYYYLWEPQQDPVVAQCAAATTIRVFTYYRE